MGYDVHLCPFPGSLYACLIYLGDPVDYDYLMSVAGAPFRRLWNRDDGGNIDLSYLGDDPFHRVFDALGYASRQAAAAAMLRKARSSMGGATFRTGSSYQRINTTKKGTGSTAWTRTLARG
ncbi:MAG: hypothetical protein KF893_19540 [Caldilineaceae bacterium]|nr:hypothetical protein [Caldilineaceae bacterium]